VPDRAASLPASPTPTADVDCQGDEQGPYHEPPRPGEALIEDRELVLAGKLPTPPPPAGKDITRATRPPKVPARADPGWPK